MNATTFRCTLDIHDIYSQFRLRIKKGDTSGRLIISLMENGKPYHITENCYAVFAGVKEKGGGILHNKCTIENNAIVYHFTKATTSTAGVIACDVLLYDQNDRELVSPSFTIEVYDSVYSEEEVESSNEFSSLTSLISAANTIVNDVTDKLNRGEFVGKQGPQGEKGEDGQDGKDGKDGANGLNGVGIQRAYVNAGGTLTFEFTDGSRFDTSTRVVGKDGVGISKIETTPELELKVTFSDGNVVNLGSIKSEHTKFADTTNGITELNKTEVMRMFVGTEEEWNSYEGDKHNVVSVITDEEDIYFRKRSVFSGNLFLQKNTLSTLGGKGKYFSLGDKIELKLKRETTVLGSKTDIYYIVDGIVQGNLGTMLNITLNDYSYKNDFSLSCFIDASSSAFKITMTSENIETVTLTDIYKIVE